MPVAKSAQRVGEPASLMTPIVAFSSRIPRASGFAAPPSMLGGPSPKKTRRPVPAKTSALPIPATVSVWKVRLPSM